MRKILMLFVMVVMAVVAMAQNPKISYQAVVRDGQNRLVTTSQVTVLVKIGSYQETFNAMTNANGLVSLQIPTDANQAAFDAINWTTASTIMTTVTIVSTSESMTSTVPITSVPYAMYANNVNPAVLDTLVSENELTVILDNYYTKIGVDTLLDKKLDKTAIDTLVSENELAAAIDTLVSENELAAAIDTLVTDNELLAAIDTLVTDNELLAAIDTLVSDNELLAAIDTLVSDNELAAAIDTLVSDNELAAAIDTLVTDNELLAAIDTLVTDNELLAAIDTLVTDNELAAAIDTLVTDNELAAAIDTLVTDNELLAAIDTLVTDSELAAAIDTLVTDNELAAAIDTLVTDNELLAAIDTLVTDSELAAAIDTLVTERELADTLDNYYTKTGVDTLLAAKVDTADLGKGNYYLLHPVTKEVIGEKISVNSMVDSIGIKLPGNPNSLKFYTANDDSLKYNAFEDYDPFHRPEFVVDLRDVITTKAIVRYINRTQATNTVNDVDSIYNALRANTDVKEELIRKAKQVAMNHEQEVLDVALYYFKNISDAQIKAILDSVTANNAAAVTIFMNKLNNVLQANPDYLTDIFGAVIRNITNEQVEHLINALNNPANGITPARMDHFWDTLDAAAAVPGSPAAQLKARLTNYIDARIDAKINEHLLTAPHH